MIVDPPCLPFARGNTRQRFKAIENEMGHLKSPPTIDMAFLERFEAGLDPQHPERSAIPARILGFGEISSIFAIEGLEDVAFKRMPIFDSLPEAETYRDMFQTYSAHLMDAGLALPGQASAALQSSSGAVALYIAQRQLPDLEALAAVAGHEHRWRYPHFVRGRCLLSLLRRHQDADQLGDRNIDVFTNAPGIVVQLDTLGIRSKQKIENLCNHDGDTERRQQRCEEVAAYYTGYDQLIQHPADSPEHDEGNWYPEERG